MGKTVMPTIVADSSPCVGSSNVLPNTDQFSNLLDRAIDLYKTHRPLSINKRAPHAQRVRTVFAMLKPNCVQDLLNEDAIQSCFTNQFTEKVWKASTIRQYILSLQKFYIYLTTKQPIYLTTNQQVIMSNMCKEMPEWRNEFNAAMNAEKVEFWRKRKAQLHSRQDVQKYYCSEQYKYCKELMKKISETETPATLTCSQYNAVLRNIVTTFHLRAAKRAGVLCKMTLEDFSNKEQEDDEFVVNIKEHKTAGVYGHSACPLNQVQSKWLDIYIAKIRPQVANTVSGTITLLLKYNGTPLTNNDVSHQLRQNWRTVGIKSHTNSTVFRQSLVTAMYKCSPSESEKQNTAALLDHDVVTGAKQYNIMLKGEKAVSAAKYATNMFIGDALVDSGIVYCLVLLYYYII